MREKTAIVVHIPEEYSERRNGFRKTFQSIISQDDKNFSLFLLTCNLEEAFEEDIKSSKVNYQLIRYSHECPGAALNQVINQFQGEYLLYINNKEKDVELRKAALSTFKLALRRNPHAGLVYADYATEGRGVLQEKRLLTHHRGRLRDNQDYGQVFLFRTEALKSCGGFSTNVRYHCLYDIRLKISEKFDLVHIGNKQNGTLYSTQETHKGHNVFDYLLAGKEVQLEAEQVVTEHLKRIGAYLKPGQGYHKRNLKGHYEYIASVIIPVNNRPQFIGKAIESVQDQTLKEIECIVVVNGGESDPTVKEVKRYLPGGDRFNPGLPPVRLVVIDINNIGLSLNRGVEIARGRYYVQLDSDDRLMPEAVEKIVKTFDEDSRIGIVIGSYEVWELDESTGEIHRMKEIPVVTHDEWTEENGRNNLLRINGAGAPRSIPIEIIKEMGYFSMNDEPYTRNYGEDYDLILKISERYRVGRVWEPIYQVVRHSGGTDHSIDQSTIDRNDEAKDLMRLQALKRRIAMNREG